MILAITATLGFLEVNGDFFFLITKVGLAFTDVIGGVLQIVPKISLLQKQEPHFCPALAQLLPCAMNTLSLLCQPFQQMQSEFPLQAAFPVLTVDKICLV